MKTIQSNWKRSLATLALLAAFIGPESIVAVAQSDKPETPPAPAPEVAPAAPVDSGAKPEGTETPLAPKPPPPPAAAEEAFHRRYGLTLGPSQGYPVDLYTNAAKRSVPLGRRYGIGGGPDAATPRKLARQGEKTARGSKIEAKLKQIVLPEVACDGLPLGEVLRFLRDESVKLDPDKTGVNFLIDFNFHPIALTGAVDPATGLPLAATPEQFDMGAVAVKFSLPLRNVTMKDVLDAIVMVADHPIGYALEDYAMVFSGKPETLEGRPVVVARPGPPPEPVQAASPKPNMLPMVTEPPSPRGSKLEFPGKAHRPRVELADVKPQPFNIDFGSGTPSEQVGPAAVGRASDFWNGVAVPFNNHHIESDLKSAEGDPSPIEVEMINLGGCCSSTGGRGVNSPMLNTYNYPTGNRGGNSTVVLHQMPAGKYNVYIYGYGPEPAYYGDYTLTARTRNYGRKQTHQKAGTIRNTKWVEGSQYVRFSNVKVGEGEEVEVLIRPGKPITDPSGRTFADAMICGLQLVPVNPLRAAAIGSRAPTGRLAGVPSPPGLVSWWRAEGDARDAAGGNLGTLGNGVAFVPGRVGQAFSFNGDNQYVRIPYSPTLIASNYSVEAWVKPLTQVSDPISQDLIFGQAIGTVQLVARPGATGVRIVFLFGTDKYTFYEVASETEIPIGEFTHLAGTWDGTTLRLYINGTLDAENSPGAAPVDSGCDFFIGGFSTTGKGYCDGEGQFFNGLIDEAAFYRRALSSAEVQASYKAGSAGKSRPAR